MGGNVRPPYGTTLHKAPVKVYSVPNADPREFPAGKVYQHGNQVTTHLNVVVGDDQGYRFIPMIVPKQKNVEDLLAGKKATKEQMTIAIEAANARKDLYPVFSTEEQALQAEQEWRREMIPKITKKAYQAIGTGSPGVEPE